MNSYDLAKLKYTPPHETSVTAAVYEGTLSTELTEEIALPEYITDVRRVLYTSAEVNAGACACADGRLECSGEVAAAVLLLTERGEIKCLNVTMPYRCTASSPETEGEETVILSLPSASGASGRLLNPRKLLVHVRVSETVRMYGKRNIEPSVNGAESVAEESAIERDTAAVECMSVASGQERDIPVSFDIELDNSLPAAAEIITCRVRAAAGECRPASDGIQLDSELEAVALYRAEDGGIQTVSRRIPNTSRVGLNRLAEGGEYTAAVTPYNIRTSVESNSFGESRIIELDMSLSAQITGAINSTADITRDAYSTSFASSNSFRDYICPSMRRCSGLQFSVTAQKPLSELQSPQVERILYSDAALRDISVVYDRERARAVWQAEADICALASAPDGEIFPITFSSPVKYDFDAPLSGQPDALTGAKALNIRARTDGVNILCDFDVTASLLCAENVTLHAVESVALDRQKRVDNTRRPSVILYYPRSGERLWDIAKHYSTTREALSTANNISGETVQSESVMIIPRKKNGPTFSKVI